MFLDLPNRFWHSCCVFSRAEKCWMWQPHGFPCSASGIQKVPLESAFKGNFSQHNELIVVHVDSLHFWLSAHFLNGSHFKALLLGL